MKYNAIFTGCTRGAIGIHYTIRTTIEGADPEAARLALYEYFDHIQGLILKPVTDWEYPGPEAKR